MRYIKALLLLLFFAFALLFFMENFKSLSTPLALKLDLFITYSSSDAAPQAEQAPTPENLESTTPPAEHMEAAPTEPAQAAVADEPVVPAGKKRLAWKADAVPLYFVVIAAFVVGVLVTACFFVLGRIRMSLDSVKLSRRTKALDKSLQALKIKATKDQEVATQKIQALEAEVQKKTPSAEAAQVG
jgi:hypothetical protein